MDSAHALRDRLQEELERIERDLAPDRAHLGRVGAELHACLENLAIEALLDSQAKTNAATIAEQEEAEHAETAARADAAKITLTSTISRLEQLLEQHRKDRAGLEAKGVNGGQEPLDSGDRLRF
jgi:hypothetical protein